MRYINSRFTFFTYCNEVIDEGNKHCNGGVKETQKGAITEKIFVEIGMSAAG